MNKSLPRRTRSIRIVVSLSRAADCRVFFFIRRVVGNILSDVVLPHTTLLVVDEHLINLLLIIFFQFLLFSIKLSPELLQLL